jgi:phage regulator Rha-like protein
MSNLSVIERDSVLVVDSRLIAPRLGIEHRSFVKTTDRYQEQITSVSDKPEDQVLRFEISKPLDNSKGGRPERFVYLTDAQASFVMTLSRNTPQVVEFKRQLVRAFEKAKQVIKEVIPPQNQEIERMKLELELIRAKQHYQDTSYAIVLSTSPAVLEWLRGETPRPKELVYRDRFLDATGQEIGSSSGRSLTQLIADAGLNPKSTKDRQTIKKILKCHGFDYDRRQGLV